MHRKTIQIFLPDGHRRGVKIAKITSRTVAAVAVLGATPATLCGSRRTAKNNEPTSKRTVLQELANSVFPEMSLYAY